MTGTWRKRLTWDWSEGEARSLPSLILLTQACGSASESMSRVHCQ